MSKELKHLREKMNNTVLKDVTFEERHMQKVLNNIHSNSHIKVEKNNSFFNNATRATFASVAIIVLVFVVLFNSEINIGEGDAPPNKEQSPVDIPKKDDKKNDDNSDDEKDSEQTKEDAEKKIVVIENKALEIAIRERLQKETGELTEADMLRLTDLYLSNMSGNLNGLEHAKNLTQIIIITDSNESIDLAKLSGLPNLWLVSIGGSGKYQNLSLLSECEKLMELHISGWVDLEQVAYLKNIWKLQVESIDVKDLTPLANLSNLGSLKLINIHFEDFSPLSNLTNLYELGIYYTFDRSDPSKEAFKNFSTIKNLKNLKWLTINNYGIKDISSLANLDKLEALTLKQNNISDISPLSNLKSLEGLYLTNNKVNKISAIANLTELSWLHLDGNNISNLEPVSNLTNLRGISLNDTKVTDLNVLENLPHIYKLEIKGAPFDDIKSLEEQLLNIPNLRELMISEKLKEKLIETGTFETLQNRNVRIYTEPPYEGEMKEWQDV
ncbi:hypothetical protein CIB95_01665 [Lottiidibacillus patelloidae]|uniref:Internalin n=1 Tax=Lottiidibacillus patelloidae TaxID=2670334 RepID=A0A263BX58_9BACI|nr:leucine-rich repeat domain-containing protein [Lottiidibacillus patelloidae]OZM58305.1 hypothetical protein CIB95_01665 [Lottiidibacillus patelloidae]